MLQFITKTQVILDDWNSPKDVVHRYQGRVLPDGIKFTRQIEGGYFAHLSIEFTARKVR